MGYSYKYVMQNNIQQFSIVFDSTYRLYGTNLDVYNTQKQKLVHHMLYPIRVRFVKNLLNDGTHRCNLYCIIFVQELIVEVYEYIPINTLHSSFPL